MVRAALPWRGLPNQLDQTVTLMPSGTRLKRLTHALLPTLALICALPVAAAAHGDHGGDFWHHGFWADDGTPDESLATITATPALSVEAWAPFNGNSLYAFVGTVSGTDTTNGTVTVNVTSSIPNGLFSGADTFDVGSQTIVLGNSSSGLFGSLGSVQMGDVVAGGLIAPSGESAATVESSPLQVLVDFPQSSSSGSSITAQASVRRAERRALRLLRREQAKYGQHRKK